MKKTQPNQDDSINRFWDRFLKVLHGQGVKPPNDRWYVVRAEHYIKAFPDKRLANHSKSDLEGYLKTLGRNSALEDWQFRQAVHAIQILFRHILAVSWIDQIDWPFWEQ